MPHSYAVTGYAGGGLLARRAATSTRLFAVIIAAFLVSGISIVAAADGATVVVMSNPANAKVFVNGYFKGRTPITVTVSSATAEAAQYRFTLVLPGYEKWDLRVSLAAGANKSIDAHLERLANPLAGRTICIDPGHPSETSAGCTGPTGVTENHINWVIALKLKDVLVARGASVVLTKSAENEKVTNRQRAAIANAANAAIMIRLHCDAAPRSGFSLYYPDRQGTKYGHTGPSAEVQAASRIAASALHTGMKSVLAGILPSRGIHGDSATYVGSRQGALTGSIFSQVPTVTIEMCVLTVASDERFINSAGGQETMVKALTAGLETYFSR
jgi:N-acetylmuramoyl-L-alanine amidase